MSNDLTDDQRAQFYHSHRERSATSYKKKHRQQFDREFAVLTGARPEHAVLEIGCGTGLFLRYLEDKGHTDIVGIDRDPDLAEALSGLSVSEVHLDDVATLLDGTLKGRTFDRIVMLDVAEHIPLEALADLMRRLRDCLRAGGKLLLRVPNIESPWGLKMFYGTFDHITPLGPGRLRELAILTGWTCEGVYPQEPLRWGRRTKERFLNGLMGRLLSYSPDVWTANVLAVYSLK